MSRLDEIKARAEAATEGPWVRDMHSPDMSGRSGWYIRGPRKLGLRSMVLNSRMLPGDAEFIEHAREDVPWLVEQVESLERWKFEACEVMSGLRELGKALGLRPGVQITGPAALAEVARLTAERDALAAKVARVEALADAADDTDGEHSHRPYDGVDWDCGQCWVCEVRAAVAEPTGQDHRCSPYWSRSICGGCGGQEANCDKCGRLMCCEPTVQEGDQ